MALYEVVVGNVGSVYRGASSVRADSTYHQYVPGATYKTKRLVRH